MARLLVPPGSYTVEVQYMTLHGQELMREKFPEMTLKSGEKKFLSTRVVGFPLSTATSHREPHFHLRQTLDLEDGRDY
jgi:hypothetical protein